MNEDLLAEFEEALPQPVRPAPDAKPMSVFYHETGQCSMVQNPDGELHYVDKNGNTTWTISTEQPSALQPSKAFDEEEQPQEEEDPEIFFDLKPGDDMDKVEIAKTQLTNYGVQYRDEDGKVNHTVSTEPFYDNMPEGMKEVQQKNGVRNHGLIFGDFIKEENNIVRFIPSDNGPFSLADPNDINAATKSLLDRRFPGCFYYGTSDQVVYDTWNVVKEARKEDAIAKVAAEPTIVEAHEEYLKNHKGHVSFKRFRDEIYPTMQKEFTKVTLETKEGPKDFMMPVEKTALRSTFLHKLKAFGTKDGFHAVDHPEPPADFTPSDLGAAWIKSLDEPIWKTIPVEISASIDPSTSTSDPDTVTVYAKNDGVTEVVKTIPHGADFEKEVEKIAEFYNVDIVKEEPKMTTSELFAAVLEEGPTPPPPFNPPGDVIRITILGDPQAQSRARSRIIHAKGGKSFVSHYDADAADKDNFRDAMQRNAPALPWTGPLRMDVFFYFGRLKAHFNSKGEVKPTAPKWKESKPDRDNLDKFVLDSMSKIYFMDDSQVCAGEIRKMYDLKPRIEIVLSKLI